MARECPACGHQNDFTANFCSSCGERLTDVVNVETEAISVIDLPAESEDGSVEAREEFAENTGVLVVDQGPKSGSRYALDSESVTAGRHPESDIFLDDVTVSRRHVLITNTGGSYRVQDVGSLNGTYVNKELVESIELTNGDELQIGRFKLLFFHGAGQ